MDLPYVMDTLFDLLNESDNLNAVELEEKEAEGKFLVTAHDGTKIMIQSANEACVSVDGFAGTVSSPISGTSVSCENVAAAEASYTVSRVVSSVSAYTSTRVSSAVSVNAVSGGDSDVETAGDNREQPVSRTDARRNKANAFLYLIEKPPFVIWLHFTPIIRPVQGYGP